MLLPAPYRLPTDSVRVLRPAPTTAGAHQRSSDADARLAACTLLKRRSTAWSVTYVCDGGVPPARLTTPRYRRIVSESTYTVPGAPVLGAPLGPPLACRFGRKSPARFVVAYTATRPPPPLPPLLW